MAVYVDPIFEAVPRTEQARKHGTSWCHMIADSDDELYAMADLIKLRREYAQDMQYGQQWRHHFDLTPAMRARAVRRGAVEVRSLDQTPVYQATAKITKLDMDHVAVMPDGSLQPGGAIEREPPIIV